MNSKTSASAAEPTRARTAFWVAVALGVALRAFLVCATRGTTDVDIWIDHARGVAERGVMGQYRADPLMNHPPPIAWWMAQLWRFANWSGIEFRIVFRAFVAAVDLGNGFLLLALLRESPQRRWIAGAYFVAPLALIFGAYHGNTDALVAACLLGATLFASRRNAWLAGALLGLGLWVKLAAVFAAPAIGFAFPKWRERWTAALSALLVASLAFAPAFALDHELLVRNVFDYRGLVLFTLSTPPTFVWGLKNAFTVWWGSYDPRVEVWSEAAAGQPANWPRMCVELVNHGDRCAEILVLVFAFLRRRQNDARGIAATIAGSFAIFYALVDAWSFQYFAWSTPFWLCAGLAFGLTAHVFAGAYIYALYAFVCDDWLLRPVWNFNGHPNWPAHLPIVRELALWTFVIFASFAFARALASEVAHSRAPR